MRKKLQEEKGYMAMRKGLQEERGFTVMRKWLQIAFLLSLAVTLCGQSTNDQQISGSVVDSTGAVVPAVMVTVTSEGTNLTRTAVTNAEGNWVVTNLPIGNYTVSAAAEGFKKYSVQNLKLETGGKLTVKATLEVGQVNESVEVQASAVQLETSSGEVGYMVTGQEAAEIQLNGRNYIQLLSLAPGVSTTYSSGFTSLYGLYGNQANTQSVNGSLPGSFAATLNGVDNKDPGGNNGTNVNISPDMLSEMRTVAGSFSAEYGINSGPTIAVSLKSGTKQYHGAAYEYFRNDAIQAYPFQPIGTKIPVQPPLRYNDFGWNLGGPAYIPGVFNKSKEKFFFFVGEEFKKRRTSAIATWVVPSLAQRNGDFSALPVAQQPKNAGVPFTGGIIPVAQRDPNMAKLLALYPLANASNGTFNFLSLNPLDYNEYVIRGDYNLSSRNQITFHLVHDGNTFLGGPTDVVNYTRVIPRHNGALTWTAIINPTTVNTLQVSEVGNVEIQKNEIRPNPLVGVADVTRAGNGVTYPTLYNISPDIPTLNLSNVVQTLTTTPLAFSELLRMYSIKNDFSKVLGNHTLKAGIVVERQRKNQDQIGAINGTFTFSTSRTGSSGNVLGDAVLGRYQQYQEISAIPQGWNRFTEIDTYLQDDWKVSQRLTVNLGLRWSYWQPVYWALGNGAAFLPSYYDPAHAATVNSAGQIVSNPYPYNGLVLEGSGFPQAATGRLPASILNDPQVLALFHGLPLGVQNTYWPLFQPRLGFAYDVAGKQSTVVRGGFGVTNDRVASAALPISNPPFLTTATIFNGNVSNPAGGSVAALPSALSNLHRLDLRPARVLNWSLGIQQKLPSNTLAQVTYSGSSGSGLTFIQDINQLPLGSLQAHPGVSANALRPYLGYASIPIATNSANYHYNSLQAQLRKQFQTAGFFNVSYTWSKNISDLNNVTGGIVQAMDSFNLKRDYGPSPYNRNQVLSISYVYPLPFWRTGREWYKKALGSWQISGATSISSGLPLNVVISSDIAGIGSNTNGLSPSAGTQRPNLIGNPFAGVGGTQYLNAAAFANPAAGTFGNLGANAIYGPMMNNWDAALSKEFRFTERMSVDFRAEFFNLPNHLSYFNVNTTLGGSTFGQVTGTTDPRTMEFVLRFKF